MNTSTDEVERTIAFHLRNWVPFGIVLPSPVKGGMFANAAEFRDGNWRGIPCSSTPRAAA